MSATLRTVIESGGFDLNTLEDAYWLVSKQKEFEELIDTAQEMIDEADEVQNQIYEADYQKWLNA